MTATLSGPSIADRKNRIREKFKAENHQPVPDKLIEKIILGINTESEVLLVDAGCVIALSLIEKGHNPDKIFVAENSDGEYVRVAERLSEIYGFHHIRINVDKMPPIMKFDYTLANPPFKGQLHLEFLQNALKMSKNVRFIHPSGWLYRNNTKLESDVKKMLENRLVKLTLFNGNSVFEGMEFQSPLVITEASEKSDSFILEYKTNGNQYKLNSMNDLPCGYWEPTQINLELKDFIYREASKQSLYSLFGTHSGGSYLNINEVVGHHSKDSSSFFMSDFYTFFYRNSDMNGSAIREKVVNLNTDQERDYLVSYLKTKFARFALALNKVNSWNISKRYLEAVPIPPLDRDWDDDSVKEFYKLTEDQWNSINSFIPDYYL